MEDVGNLIEILEEEISKRELLDPHYFADLKNNSLNEIIKLRVSPEAARKILGIA